MGGKVNFKARQEVDKTRDYEAAPPSEYAAARGQKSERDFIRHPSNCL